MPRDENKNPLNTLTDPHTFADLAALILRFEKAPDLQPEDIRCVQLAKVALRQLEDAGKALVQEQVDQARRARDALQTLLPTDLVNLPLGVKEQLRLTRNDEKDMQIYSALESLGGSATLEKLLIELWKQHRVQIDRKSLTRRLHSLVEKAVIFRQKGRRGEYHTHAGFSSLRHRTGESRQSSDSGESMKVSA